MTLPQPPEYCDYRCVAFKYSLELGLGNPDLTHSYVQGVHGHDCSIDESYCLCCITAALVAFLCRLRSPCAAHHVTELELETAFLFCAPGTLDVTCVCMCEYTYVHMCGGLKWQGILINLELSNSS